MALVGLSLVDSSGATDVESSFGAPPLSPHPPNPRPAAMQKDRTPPRRPRNTRCIVRAVPRPVYRAINATAGVGPRLSPRFEPQEQGGNDHQGGGEGKGNLSTIDGGAADDASRSRVDDKAIGLVSIAKPAHIDRKHE